MGRGPAAVALFVGPGNVTVKQPCVCTIKAPSPLRRHTADFGRVSSKSGTSSNYLLSHSRDLPCQYFLIGLDRAPSPAQSSASRTAAGSGHVLPLLQVETASISASSTFDFRCLSFSLFLSTPCPPLAPPPGSHHTAIPVAALDPLPRVAVGSVASDRTRLRTRALAHGGTHGHTMAPSRSRPSAAGWRHLPAIVAALTLSWTTTVSAAGESAGDYFVHSLPGAPEGPLVKMHAG